MCCCRVNGVYCVTNTDAPYCSKTSVKGSPYCCPPTSQPNTIDSVDHSMRLSEDEDYNSSSDVNGHNHNKNNWNNGRTDVRRGGRWNERRLHRNNHKTSYFYCLYTKCTKYQIFVFKYIFTFKSHKYTLIYYYIILLLFWCTRESRINHV